MLSLFNKNSTSDADLLKMAKMLGIRGLRICYASETNKRYKGPQIVNLDKVGGRGTHWCVYYDGDYFDPLGCPPPPAIEAMNPDYNEIQIQPVDQAHCGQWCLCFISAKQKNKLAEFYKENKQFN